VNIAAAGGRGTILPVVHLRFTSLNSMFPVTTFWLAIYCSNPFYLRLCNGFDLPSEVAMASQLPQANCPKTNSFNVCLLYTCSASSPTSSTRLNRRHEGTSRCIFDGLLAQWLIPPSNEPTLACISPPKAHASIRAFCT
jgi:hypothetical protein